MQSKASEGKHNDRGQDKTLLEPAPEKTFLQAAAEKDIKFRNAQNLSLLRRAVFKNLGRLQTRNCRGGPHMRSLISIDFPAPKMEPESAHVVLAVSVHWLQCGDCDAARPRQHTTPGQKFFLLTSCSNPLPLDSWQFSYESHGGSRISWFALKEFLLYSDLKYDPPRRPREMRIINPRLRIMMLIRR